MTLQPKRGHRGDSLVFVVRRTRLQRCGPIVEKPFYEVERWSLESPGVCLYVGPEGARAACSRLHACPSLGVQFRPRILARNAVCVSEIFWRR